MFDRSSRVLLQENLLDQVRLSELADDQRPIAEMIIGNIDDYGYLKASLDELAFSAIFPRKSPVLKIIQSSTAGCWGHRQRGA